MFNRCKKAAREANVVLDAVTLPPVPTDDTMSKLSSSAVSSIVKQTLGATVALQINDRDYFGFKRGDVEAFLKSSKISELKYQRERFDCDDFAAVLRGEFLQWFALGHSGSGEERGAAFGCITGDLRKASDPDKTRYHAMNCFIGANGALYVIEPQTDQITTWGRDYAETAKVWSVSL